MSFIDPYGRKIDYVPPVPDGPVQPALLLLPTCWQFRFCPLEQSPWT